MYSAKQQEALAPVEMLEQAADEALTAPEVTAVAPEERGNGEHFGGRRVPEDVLAVVQQSVLPGGLLGAG